MIDTKYLRQTAWQFFLEGIKNTSKNGHVKILFFRLFFFSIWVLFHEYSRITGLQGKGEGHSINSSLPLPPASQAIRQ